MLSRTVASCSSPTNFLPLALRSSSRTPVIETMEKRELMSASFSISGHVLTITADPYGYQGLDVAATSGGTNLRITTSSNGTHTYDKVLGNFSTRGLQKIVFNGSPQPDTFTLESSVNIPAVIYGGNGGDYLQGGSANDSIYGGNGNDMIIGGAGADLMVGSAGNDFFDARDGNTTDKIYGGETDGSLSGSDTAEVDQHTTSFSFGPFGPHPFSVTFSDKTIGVSTVHKWTY